MNATMIIAGDCNITPNLALGNSNDILSENASHKVDKFILIDETTESNWEENSEAGDISTELFKYGVKNKGKIILVTLNINSIGNKFCSLSEIIANNIEVSVILEQK